MLTVDARTDRWPSGEFTGIVYHLTADCLRAANIEQDAIGAGVLTDPRDAGKE